MELYFIDMFCYKTWYGRKHDILITKVKLLKRFTKFKSGRTNKDVIFKCIVKSSTANISFQDIEEQIEKNENIFLGIGHLISK